MYSWVVGMRMQYVMNNNDKSTHFSTKANSIFMNFPSRASPSHVPHDRIIRPHFTQCVCCHCDVIDGGSDPRMQPVPNLRHHCYLKKNEKKTL